MARRRRLKKPPITLAVSNRVYDPTGNIIKDLKTEYLYETVDDVNRETGEITKIVRARSGQDILFAMFSRKQIDQSRYDAGREWEKLYEQSQVGTVGAIDPGKEAVDGGQIYQAINDLQLDALRKLQAAYRMLGSVYTRTVFDILGLRKSIMQLAAETYMTERERNKLGADFREALNKLALHWGMATALSERMVNKA